MFALTCKSLCFFPAPQRGPETLAWKPRCALPSGGAPPPGCPRPSSPSWRASGPMSLPARSCCVQISSAEIASGNGACLQRHQSNCCKQQKKKQLGPLFWELTFFSFCGNAADTSVFLVAKCVKVIGHLFRNSSLHSCFKYLDQLYLLAR